MHIKTIAANAFHACATHYLVETVRTTIKMLIQALSQPNTDGIRPTNILKPHLAALQELAVQENCIIGIRPVDPMARTYIKEGYPTKNLNIKGKSASWGPQAGLVCVDQHYSKLENLKGPKPEIIEKFSQAVETCIAEGHAKKSTLILSSSRIRELLRNKALLSIQRKCHGFILEAVGPSGSLYKFEATAAGSDRYAISHDGAPLQILTPPSARLPFTADYDLLLLAPALQDLDYRDNLNILNDPQLGDTNPRIAQLIPALNQALVGTGERLIHHGADSDNRFTDPKDNYPATLFLPKQIGRFEEICIISNTEEMHEFIQAAKDNQYHVSINPKWEDEITHIRRHTYTEARHTLDLHYSQTKPRASI